MSIIQHLQNVKYHVMFSNVHYPQREEQQGQAQREEQQDQAKRAIIFVKESC